MDKVKELIEEAKEYTFQKNCYHHPLGIFSRPSPEMHAWIAECEDFLLTNYSKESGPWKIFFKV